METQRIEKSITLLTLPPEIQTKILSHLVVDFGKSSIQAVLRTCKQLYEVALPLSVSVFRNTECHPSGKGRCSQALNVRFLRYILFSKPWLARHVKTVIMGQISSNDGDIDQEEEGKSRPQDESKITDEEHAIYRQHIEFVLGQLPSGYNEEWCARWAIDLKRGTSDAQISLILLICPNIRTILYEMSTSARNFFRLLNLVRNLSAIDASIHSHGSEWGDGNGNADCPRMTIPLSNVQDIFHETLNYDAGYKEFCMEGPELFALPRLRFYECLMANGNHSASRKFGELPRRCSTVEEITLHCADTTEDVLQNMLGACRALRKLEYSHYVRFNENLSPVMPQDILNAILPHADTLEDLYLNLAEIYAKPQQWTNYPQKMYMGTRLHQMQALKRLTLGMQALTGMLAYPPLHESSTDTHVPLRVEGAPTIIDCLPENLEYLKIRDCGVAILEQVAELIRVVEQGHRFKKLTYIGLIFNGWRRGLDLDWPEVKKLHCSAPNVCLDIGHQSYSSYVFDLGADSLSIEEEQPHNIMSRIYAPDLRQVYLDTRGVTSSVDPHYRISDDPGLR